MNSPYFVVVNKKLSYGQADTGRQLALRKASRGKKNIVLLCMYVCACVMFKTGVFATKTLTTSPPPVACLPLRKRRDHSGTKHDVLYGWARNYLAGLRQLFQGQTQQVHVHSSAIYCPGGTVIFLTGQSSL